MDNFHATRVALRGLPGGDRCPADPVQLIGTEESGGLRLPGARGGVFWAVFMSAVAASAVVFAGPVPTSYIYGIDDNSKLWVMALSGTAGTAQELTGVTTGITSGSANGLAYDSGREQLFVVNQSNDELFWWQQGATSFTSLGTLPTLDAGLGKSVSAAFYNDAYWFLGNGTQGNLLGKVSLTYTNGVPSIGAGTTFVIDGMPTSFSGGGDMAITPGGTLYAFSGPSVGNFFTADLTSITLAPPTVFGYQSLRSDPNAADVGLQVAFNTDSTTLYGQDYASGSWYTVNTTSGNTTPVDLTTAPVGGGGFRDLAGSSVQAVPEPSSLALAAVGGGILVWQVSRRRRRRMPHVKLSAARESDQHRGRQPLATACLA